MKNLILFTSLFWLSQFSLVYSQYSINPTRPSASDNGFITSWGFTELEIGGLAQKDFYSVPALLKFSPVSQLEFAVSFSGLINHSTAGSDSETDFGDVGIQLKSPFYSCDNFSTAILGKVEFPSQVNPKYTFYSASSFIMQFGQVDLTLGAVLFDIVTEYDQSFIYAIAFSPKVDLPVGIYVEIFGERVSGLNPVSIDAGIAYSAGPNLVFDAAIAKGLNDYAADLVFQIGLTTKLFQLIK